MGCRHWHWHWHWHGVAVKGRSWLSGTLLGAQLTRLGMGWVGLEGRRWGGREGISAYCQLTVSDRGRNKPLKVTRRIGRKDRDREREKQRKAEMWLNLRAKVIQVRQGRLTLTDRVGLGTGRVTRVCSLLVQVHVQAHAQARKAKGRSPSLSPSQVKPSAARQSFTTSSHHSRLSSTSAGASDQPQPQPLTATDANLESTGTLILGMADPSYR